MKNRPDTWAAATIEDVCAKCDQRIPRGQEKFQYVDITSIDRQRKAIVNPQTLLGVDAPSRARKVVKQGDVIVSMTRPNLNAVALVPEDLDGQIASTGFDVLRSSNLDKRWLYYIVRTNDFIDQMSASVQGALYPAVRSKDIRGYAIPIAPVSEQKRIADKLDALLVRLDACREHLDRMPAILKRFRQSVLLAATSGRLTEEWRAVHGQKKDWPLVGLADVGELGRGKSKHRPRNDPRLYGGNIPFIQTGAVAQSGGLITQHEQNYSQFGLEQSKLWPAGTVCITIAANIADTAVLTYPACFPDSVVGFVVDSSKSFPEFIKWTIDNMKDSLDSFASATAQKNINLAVLNKVKFHCPPFDEQEEIVRLGKTLFAYADRLETRFKKLLSKVDGLTPAILAKAFRGELVPQDPNDEPASLLLERIRATRAAAPAQKRGKRGAVRPMKIRKPESIMLQRHDIEPKHLTTILKERGPLTAEALWSASQLDIDDFYDQLKIEEEQGLLREQHSNAGDSSRQLEAAP